MQATPTIEKIDNVEVSDNWDEYLSNIDIYAEKHKIDLSNDPFNDLLSADEKREIVQRINEDYKIGGTANCDKWDYIFSAVSAVIAGLIDLFFVGMPGKSKLGNWTNAQADKIVEKFANVVYKIDRNEIEKEIKTGNIRRGADYAPTGKKVPQKEPKGIASSIGYLESRFNVPYDARYAKDLKDPKGTLSLSPQDHHLKSLGHSPDVAGLFFSILDQFTNKVTIIENGSLHRYESNSTDFRLQGKTFFEKIIFGIINWIGCIASDIAGNSGTRGHEGKVGAGIGAPFFEFFQLCNFGQFKAGEDTQTLAQFTTIMYKNGYDARFAAAQSVPVVFNEVIIRLFWSIKRHYYHKKSWAECAPVGLSKNPELRRMLLMGHGCLCLVNAGDAFIRSKGELLSFALHINIVAWSKFANLGFQEIRALYNKNALNVEQMETDLSSEWQRLLNDFS